MQTSIAETAATVQFDAALTALTQAALTAYPGEEARILRGLGLVRRGHVELRGDGTAWVRSERYDMRYRVANGHCACQDMAAPDHRCKHAWAKTLLCRARKAVLPLRHAYHLVDGVEGHARVLDAQRAVFHPGGHKHSFVCAVEDLCVGPVVH